MFSFKSNNSCHPPHLKLRMHISDFQGYLSDIIQTVISELTFYLALSRCVNLSSNGISTTRKMHFFKRDLMMNIIAKEMEKMHSFSTNKKYIKRKLNLILKHPWYFFQHLRKWHTLNYSILGVKGIKVYFVRKIVLA